MKIVILQELEDEIKRDINWRIEEIALLKKNCTITNISQQRIKIIKKYSPVCIYALLEGFVKNTIQSYIKSINKLNLSSSVLSSVIISKELELKHNLFIERKDTKSQEKLFINIERSLKEDPFLLSECIEVEKNINLNNLNKELKKRNIAPIENDSLKKELNKLLEFRNTIAHGENHLKINNSLLSEFSRTLIHSMDEICDTVCSSFEKECYLRKH